ncbi:hypothetical protein Y1Q_0006126 [Alligator mississippiensis]|uniref:Uncharacterized protein n=1 Tax=Alligator mississippiensis TaxID=8496 RepID=A0A151N4L5_ALLMI|nr:hypothetical protein Y1Q_0006126 [Alligator mississippiensis]
MRLFTARPPPFDEALLHIFSQLPVTRAKPQEKQDVIELVPRGPPLEEQEASCNSRSLHEIRVLSSRHFFSQ